MPKATGVSPGIGLANALLWRVPVAFDYIPRQAQNPATELARIKAARAAILQENDELREKTARQFGREEAVIFDFYRMMLEDDEALLQPMFQKVERDGLSAGYAISTRFDELARQFLQLDDEYMRMRVDDLYNLRDQLMRHVLGAASQPDFSHLDHPAIIVAHSLSPVDIAGFDLSRLEGIICETGSYSTHMSIIARTLGIPAVVGAQDITSYIHNDMMVALDGDTGEVWIRPNKEELETLRRRSEALAQHRAATQTFRGQPTVSTDGRRVELSASVGQLDEVPLAIEADAESVGLFRTELVHTTSGGLPSEEMQLAAYRKLLDTMKGKAVTVRTFDDGGNEPRIPLKPSREANPVLGQRGIRLSLAHPGFFRVQLRALLRASAYGSLKLLFPMISTLDELERVLATVDSVKEELRSEDIPFDPKLPIGVAVETPASALLSETFAKKVDFLLVALNDLIQFTLAIDRNNPNLAHLYHQYHPAMLRLVGHTIDACHTNGIPCIISGEAPGTLHVLPVLFGMGADGFSVNPGTLLQCRQILNSRSYSSCRRLAGEVLQMQTAAEVKERLHADAADEAIASEA